MAVGILCYWLLLTDIDTHGSNACIRCAIWLKKLHCVHNLQDEALPSFSIPSCACACAPYCCLQLACTSNSCACQEHTDSQHLCLAVVNSAELCSVVLCCAQVCAMLVECLELRRKWLFRSELQPEQRRVRANLCSPMCSMKNYSSTST